MFDVDVIKGWIASLIRMAGAGTIAWLIAHGYLTTETAGQAIVIIAGAVALLVSSLISKIWQSKKVDAALKLPANSSKTTLKNVIEGQ